MGTGAGKQKPGEIAIANCAPQGGGGQPSGQPPPGGAPGPSPVGPPPPAPAAPKPSPEKPRAPQDVKRPKPGAKKGGASQQPSLEEEGSSGEEPPPAALAQQGPSPPNPSTAASATALPETISVRPAKRLAEDEELDGIEEAEAHDMGKGRSEAPPEDEFRVRAEVIGPPKAPPRKFSPEDLMSACREGDDATVEAFLLEKARTAKGLADCEAALFDAYGDSVLHHAVQNGFEKVVKLLLQLGRLQVDIPNARNETALQLGCRRSEKAIVSVLLQAEADPNRRDVAGLSPFLSGVFAGASEEALEMLVRAKADVSAQDSRGVGAFHFAALRGDTPLMEWLLKHQADVNVQTEHGTTPLMLASKRGHTDGVSLLLGGKANTGLADEAGCTALMQALSAASAAAARKILHSGAAVEAVDCAGRSALFHAVLGGVVDNLRAVIECGGRVNILDEEGRSPLYQSCLMGAESLATCLLEASANPNLAGRGTTVRPLPAQRPEGEGGDSGQGEEDREADAARACLEEARTCLQVCATLAHNSILALVLGRGADINAAPGVLGWTSLHLCAAVGNDDGAALLLERGAMIGLEDAEGNTAVDLAERAGHQAMHARLREAAAAEPLPGSDEGRAAASPKARRQLGALPPLHAANPDPDPPAEEVVPLAAFQEDWEKRGPDGSLLDRVFGPMVHDALQSDHWRVRWEALTHLSTHFSEAVGAPADVIAAVGQVVTVAAMDKIPKVFLASLAVFEELLSEARADVVGPEEFAALLRGEVGAESEDSGSGCDALLVLLDQTDAGGGSSSASSPQQAATDALCSCILHGRMPLDEAAFPLLKRVDERLLQLVREDSGQTKKDRKEAALGPKCLATNFKLMGRWLSAFGLQRSGLFRRALLLPLMLRGMASEHSKVRSAAGDALVQLIALSGGLEERVWSLLPSKARKAVQRCTSSQESTSLVTAAPCEEDAVQKSTIVSEDSRANGFICVSELTPRAWAAFQAGEPLKGACEKTKLAPMSAKAAVAMAANDAARGCGNYAAADDAASSALYCAFESKNWKDRAGSIAALTNELASASDGVKLIEDPTDGGGGSGGGGPLLSQYVLRGHRISTLQGSFHKLLGDTVTAVFVATADLLRLVCGLIPLYIAPLFLEPLLPSLLSRLIDTSKKVRDKSLETTMEVAALHGCALSEMIAQCVASGSAWSTAASPRPAGIKENSSGHGCDRSTGPRLQLLLRLVRQAQETAGKWTDETWQALADYALKAAEHRNGDVRKDVATLLNSLQGAGDRAEAAANRAVAQMQAIARSTRPTTGSTRLGTGATRPGTGSTRLGSAADLRASGRLSQMESTGFTLPMGSTGRLSTAMRSKTSNTGTRFRPNTGSTNRPGTGQREVDEESDNSIKSTPDAPEVPAADGGGEDGVKFYDVKTACPGAEEVPDLAEGAAALREALPLAEPLDEVALDFVAPLIALFGDGWTRCFYSRQWQCRVAALMHLSANMAHRLEEITGPEVSPNALGELLDGTMRAVHEGLGDQNVRVYAEACLSVGAVVPAFCGVVDGRLLVAHLAPLLRQLCARMGDSKEVVRTQTTQALFRLLHPPTGNIVSPMALAMLVLRHLTPAKVASDQGAEQPTSIAKGGSGAPGQKGAATGWLCRLAALRDLVKEYSKNMVQQPGATHPNEWLKLKDGLAHADPTVRHESARLYALVCKMHLRSLGDEEAQRPGRESWVAALPRDLPKKSIIQVRRLLKLPEEAPAGEVTSPKQGKLTRASHIVTMVWEIPVELSCWAGCKPEVLSILRQPGKGDEKAVVAAVRALGRAACALKDAKKRSDMSAEEAFAHICKAVQQVLGSVVGADRACFLCAVDLCQTSVAQLAPTLSGLDINMGLAKTFPTLMERTTLTGASDVKVGVASDKLVQQLAKHPKVGCEAVTKMVITAISRLTNPLRPLVLLSTLLSDFGLRLCAQRDVVSLLLGAIGTRLERLVPGNTAAAAGGAGEEDEVIRPQLVSVLATVNQFSPDTVQYCMSEIEPAHRKLILTALQEAPDPRLMALGATAAEQDLSEATHVAGSAIRAASRGRGQSPSPKLRTHDDGEPSRSNRRPDGAPSHSTGSERRRGPPRADESGQLASSSSTTRLGGEGSPSIRDASPSRRHRSNRRHRDVRGGGDSPQPAGGGGGGGSEASNAPFSSTPSGSPRQSPPGFSSSTDLSRMQPRWGSDAGGGPLARPPAPMGLSTALSSSRFGTLKEGEFDNHASSKNLERVNSSEGRLLKSKEAKPNDSLQGLMDVLSKMEDGRGRTR